MAPGRLDSPGSKRRKPRGAPQHNWFRHRLTHPIPELMTGPESFPIFMARQVLRHAEEIRRSGRMSRFRRWVSSWSSDERHQIPHADGTIIAGRDEGLAVRREHGGAHAG